MDVWKVACRAVRVNHNEMEDEEYEGRSVCHMCRKQAHTFALLFG